MNRILIISLLSVALTHVGAAHADDDDDLPEIARSLCSRTLADATKESEKQKFCLNAPALEKTRSKYLPNQYYVASNSIDVCGALKDFRPHVQVDLGARIDRVCALPAPDKRSASDLTLVGVSLVQGLGDLLVAEAKESALEYLLTKVGKKFCDYKVAIGRGAKKLTIEFKTWFENSCEVILPDAKDIDVDAFTFGGLKIAFRDDLNLLPQKVAGLAKDLIDTYWKDARPYITTLGIVSYAVFEVVRHKRLLDVILDLGAKAEEELKKQKVTCDLRAGQGAPGDAPRRTKECLLLLGIELARTAANDPKGTPPATVLQHTIEKFCTNFGAAGLETSGKCVIDPVNYEKLHTDLLVVYRAMKRILELDQTIARVAQSSFTSEVSKRAAADWSQALRQLMGALGNLVADLEEDAAQKERVKKDFAFLDLNFDLFDAVLSGDAGELRKALIALVDSEVFDDKAKLDSEVKHVLTVIIGLATSKDRLEVKGILADITAPVGTYKAKYDNPRVMWTVNGYVGFFVGYEARTHGRTADGTKREAAFDEMVPLRLSAPVGFDVTLRSRKHYHVGVTVTAIDPLALAVSTANDTVSADWKTLFTPGAFVRVGIARSPFTLLGGIDYQWARRSSDMCGSERCFDGAAQIMAGLAVDVPLFVLR
ncbi:MAG: hypothetical protein KIT31_34425 [Deltaproteobacteria bacterium]|nr:hypothetical protein [Deltaproteobacteria bacterium]